jgi:hypothetical protein
MDHGFKNCQLMASLPYSEDVQDIEAAFGASLAFSQRSVVNIWSLQAEEEYTAPLRHSISRFWRKSIIGTWTVARGQTGAISDTISCGSRSLLSFELSCSTEDCEINLQQDRSYPSIGWCFNIIYFALMLIITLFSYLPQSNNTLVFKFK